MLEQSCSPKERLLALLKYSRPIGTDKNKRAFVVRKRQTVTDQYIGKILYIPKSNWFSLSIKEEEKSEDDSKKKNSRKAFIESRRLLFKRKMMGDAVGSESNPIPAFFS